ncbi:PLP-dependent transferase, partial [Pseudovirgaria hyperparasitica]
LGTAIPEARHAISVQIPTWRDMCGLGGGDLRVMKALRNGYPRSFLHQDIRRLNEHCQRDLDTTDMLLLFPSELHASACREYLVKHKGAKNVRLVARQFGNEAMSVHLWATVFPADLSVAGALFWRLTGTGISSRLAEKCLTLKDMTDHVGQSYAAIPLGPLTPAGAGVRAGADLAPLVSPYQVIQGRIAGFLRISDPSDVFLYPSGMSAIYHLHHLLLQWRGLASAIIGFPYELTIKMLQTYGPGLHFYSMGTDAEIDRFETDLAQGIKVQAVWCECPSNPLLWTVDLSRVRRLADRFDFLVIVDDTIGTFANVNVMPVADVVVTSLSKSFNGFADLLAGSLTLNAASPHHETLKKSLVSSYTNNVYIDDAIQLEHNSRNFLRRQSILNTNAAYLADYAYPLTKDPCSVVKAVYYPKVSPSARYYEERMWEQVDDFTPGYGCLLTIDFKTVAAAVAFFDNLHVLKGPSLGLHHTLAQPYVQMVLQNEKQWAASHGIMETIVRISAGLEDKETLLGLLQVALKAAQ